MAALTRDGARWVGGDYERVAVPHRSWAQRLVDLFDAPDGTTVLDAGCGTGLLMSHLLATHRRTFALGVDRSASMLDQAAQRLRDHRERIRLVRADLRQPLPMTEPLDGAISSATFHWIADHDALFANLSRHLRTGAPLTAQWGGEGNLARVQRTLATLGWDSDSVWNFPSRDATARRLQGAGFDVEEVTVHEDPFTPDDDASLRQYLRFVVLPAHLASLDEGAQDRLVASVAGALPDRTLDYVRLTAVARKARDA